MAWSLETTDKFERITGYDYASLLREFIDFNSIQKQKIFNYHSGATSTPNGEAFKRLDRLREEFKSAVSILSLNKEAFADFNDWELFEEIEQISGKLDTIFNSSKFFRSARIAGSISPTPSIEVTLGNQQTLEGLSSTLAFENPQDDWSKLFLENQLTEESYTSDGGALLSVSLSGAAATPLTMTSVVDNINTAEKTYGIDIQREIEFSGNDLKTLTYKDTRQQSLDILTSLFKGSNPENPTQGIDRSIVLGTTLSSVAFPSIFRQMAQNFESDDSFVSFAIADVYKNGDSLVLNYQVRDITNEVIKGEVSI